MSTTSPTGPLNSTEEIANSIIKNHLIRLRRIRRNPEDLNLFAEATPDEIRALDDELAEKKRQKANLCT